MRCAALVGLGCPPAALVTACASRERAVADPRVGQTFYLCCNLHYDKPEITDANYTQGSLVPFATRVEIAKVTRQGVVFKPAGHAQLTLDYRHGGKATFDQYLNHLFVTDDPTTKIGRAACRE